MTGRRDFTFADPTAQQGFVMIPNAVLHRTHLSAGAKLVYGYMKYLAWVERSAEADSPMDQIAGPFGVTEKTASGWVKELRAEPCDLDDPEGEKLVTAKRRGQGQPNSYIIGEPRTVKTTDPERQKVRNPARARQRREEQDVPNIETPPPPLVQIEGRNLGLDALAEECGVDPNSPRYVQAVTALNGRTTRRTQRPGIRDLFWRELLRWAAEHPDEAHRLDELGDEPERFERALATAIRRKAALYRERLDGAILTPKALHDWWLDLERQRPTNGGMSADEIARMNG